MKPLPSVGWRSLRYLLPLIGVGGLLAADNSWMSTVKPAFLDPSRWFSSAAGDDAVELPAAANLPVGIAPQARLSMDRLLHGLLFERPTGRWALSSRVTDTQSSLPRRLVEFDQINPISPGDNFSTYEMRASWAPIAAAPSTPINYAPSAPQSPAAVTASGSWSANASGNWSDPGNWSAGVVADGATSQATFSLIDITTDVTVTLDTSRTIGSVQMGDANQSHSYSIVPSGGSSLTFQALPMVPSQLLQLSLSAGDTIAVPIFIKNNLTIGNFSSTNPFTITGNLASSATSGSFQTVTFQALPPAGNIDMAGNISDGTTGATISVAVTLGTVTFGGTNTYTGSTSVDGTLLINGNNSGATAPVFVSGVVGGTGTVGGTVMTFDGTITGGTTTTVGALTLLQNVNLATMEGTGTYLANLSGSLSDLLAISGQLILGTGSTLDIEGTADGVTTYTLATFGSRDGTFQFENDIPANYMLVYTDSNIQLVPIPEPATWIGGGLALAAIGWMSRRRLRRRARVA